MSDVKRYDIVSDSCGWWPEGSTTGDYVLYDDYEDDTAALLARITSLEREKEEARDKAMEDAVFRMATVYANFDVLTLADGHKVTRRLVEAVEAMKGTKP